eukprot:s2146_g3.t1
MSEAESDVQAVFAYGTLRGDYSEKGDAWGVITSTGAAWIRASVPGFRLYQEDVATYPFALHSENQEDILHGTLLIWSHKDARQAIDRCDSIEGFDPRAPDDGLYRRAMVEVSVGMEEFLKASKDKPWLEELLIGSAEKKAETTSVTLRAFVYHQLMDGRAKEVVYFPSGDWIRSRSKRPI